MRAAILIGLMFAAASASAETGVVRGTVVCEGTSEPVSGVRITVGVGITAFTDGAGRFFLPNAPAGNISLRAQREGYFGPAVDGDFPRSASAPVFVKASEPANVNITLIPAGSVSGSVFDSEGKPLYNSVVGILRVVYRRGSRTVDVVEANPSDKRGEFRLYPLPPGEYYIGAAPPPGAQGTTLYPSTTSLNLASRIVVRPAQETKGIDIRLRLGK
jgi:hypothetical protein